jgi:hypothetical protein
VFHLLVAKQEFNAMEQVRLGLQAAVNPDNIKEMWKEYTEAVFPWAKKATVTEHQKARQILEQEASEGAFTVKPMPLPTARSRLHVQAVRKPSALSLTQLSKGRDPVLPAVSKPRHHPQRVDRKHG